MDRLTGAIYRDEELLAGSAVIFVETSIVVAGGRKILQGRTHRIPGLLVGGEYAFRGSDGRKGRFRVFQFSPPDQVNFEFSSPLE